MDRYLAAIWIVQKYFYVKFSKSLIIDKPWTVYFMELQSFWVDYSEMGGGEHFLPNKRNDSIQRMIKEYILGMES